MKRFLREEIEILVNKGQIIVAIKAVHNATNLGLAISKSFIDHLLEINWEKCDLNTYIE
jgi:ribosomal protein L7/L12